MRFGSEGTGAGRFEDALATFKQADRFDTPQVSRWTWMIGAGWANMLMGRAEDAVPWLLKSIAITAASGRTHMLLAAAYQQMGKTEEARAAMEKGRELRPGSTYHNVPTPKKHSGPVYIEAAERIMQLMVAAGLPDFGPVQNNISFNATRGWPVSRSGWRS